MAKIIIEADSTLEGIEIYNRLQKDLGNMILAELKGGQCSEKELILTNEDDEKIIFRGCFSSGNKSEETKGTHKVLTKAGFSINLKFVENNPGFKIEK